MRAAASKGSVVRFEQSKCWIRNKLGRLKGMGSLVGKLYHLDCEPLAEKRATSTSEQESDTNLWHQRLGHQSEGHLLSNAVRKEMATGICSVLGNQHWQLTPKH